MKRNIDWKKLKDDHLHPIRQLSGNMCHIADEAQQNKKEEPLLKIEEGLLKVLSQAYAALNLLQASRT